MSEETVPQDLPIHPLASEGARPRRWLRLALLLVIFFSGLVVGVGVTLLAVRQGMLYGIHHPEEMPVRVARRLRGPLNLSDQQAGEIESIIRQRQSHLQEIRRRFQPEVEAELEQVYEEIGKILDDAQRERWEQIYTHLRETWNPPLPKPQGLEE
jgi:hypothetical protein